MDISTVNGRIAIVNNGYGVAKTLSAYICTPDRDIVCRIKGITAFNATIKGLNDFSEIAFEVQKYTTNQSTLELELNDSYAYLHSFCEVFIPEFGSNGYFIILNEPTISSTGKMAESKSFTVFSYEAVLQYRNLIGFKVNQGTVDSLEMIEANIDPATRRPTNFIKLYDPQNADYSLLDLVLREDYYGWKVGTVDPSIASLARSFDIENQNVYSFLCSDAAKAFRCVFQFDTAHKLINVTSIENFGNNTNIYLSLSHFLNQIDVAPQTEDIYTVFNVRGDNDMDISWVNFGSNKIYNVEYPLSFLDEDIQNGYRAYKAARDSARAGYIDKQKQYANLLQIKDSIEKRVPVEEIENNWVSEHYYTTEELNTILSNCQAFVTNTESFYRTPQGGLDEEALEMSADAARYYSYKSIIIPDIQAELAARARGEHDENPVDPMFVYEVYGLTDLELRQTLFEDTIKALRSQGYDGPSWNPSMTIAQITWNAHHQEYNKYNTELNKLKAVINKKRAQVAEIDEQMTTLLNQMKTLAQRASLDNFNGLTSEQKSVIKSLYRESDYTDSNYLLTDYDDVTSTVNRQNELYEAAEARLEIESVPQFTWTVMSANLYAIPAFNELREQLQIGDFITLGFDMYGIADYMTDQMQYKEGGIKFRIVQIDFDGINFSGNFQINFSNMIQTAKYRNDFETLLDSFVSSKTNQITAGVSNTASSVAAIVATSIIRPYIEATDAKINNANIINATIEDLTATNAKIHSIVADMIETDSFKAQVAELVDLSVFDLRAEQITADKSITLVSDNTGSIELRNSRMIFKDADGDIRVSIGKKDNDEYDISIYSAADQYGQQEVLFDSTGIHKAAFQGRIIETQMVEWDTIAEGVDANNKPYFSAHQVETSEGERLDVSLNRLKAIEISASNQFFIIRNDGSHDPSEIMLSAYLQMVTDRGQISWYYQDNNTWVRITNYEASATQPYLTNDNNIFIPYGWSVFNDSVVIKAVYGNDTLTDTISLFKVEEGSSAINVILSNEAQTIATDQDNVPYDDATYICDVLVMRGVTALYQTSSNPTHSQYTMTVSCLQAGITNLSTSNGRISFKTDPTVAIPDNFVINVLINIGGVATPISKQISLSASSAGESAITVEIQSSSGVIFKNRNISSILTARVLQGNEDITNRVTSFTWRRKDQYGTLDPSWTRTLSGNSITITPSDVLNKSIFECEVSFT